jgi:broad specificity phosphatase PhoE
MEKTEKRKVKITYFVHGTTTDNEKGMATGCNPGELSELGVKQTKQLKEQIKDRDFDVVFCSDLKRAADSADILFGDKHSIILDKRLRECDYGDMNGATNQKVRGLETKCIDKPYPNGESFKDVENRIMDFLKDLLKDFKGMKVALVSHRAPQLALDVIIKGMTWKRAFKDDWRRKQPKQWRPGWEYVYSG